MPAGGVLSIKSEKKSSDDFSDGLEIVVCDTGCGIAEKDLARIFEPFYTNKERGTGLGLAIVNRIVEYNKGTIIIESEVDKGTRCFLQLPMAAGDGK